MGKKVKATVKKPGHKQPPVKKSTAIKKGSVLPWVIVAAGITALCFSPMLKNQFTNWDDEYYVINNLLLRGPDWKGIFTQPLVGNYHPLTVVTLAINYQLSELNPSSYLLVNLLLHVINTCLVFYFAWIISNKKTWVAFLVALIFGIHPLHVESVAWVSERKDVLYTFFFVLALIQYWRFLETNNRLKYWLCFLLFTLSLLSKPAAIIFPLVLLLLDYWKGRPINAKLLTNKIPFFILAIIFAVITMQVQTKAIAGFAYFPLWERLFFACYVVMIYFIRFFIPYPLSAFHPYPSPDHLGWAILVSPLFILALLGFLWYQRKNKLFVFGILFFIVNLLLVLQIISIGLTIVSERYTYVPYIGLSFLLAMWLDKLNAAQYIKWALPAAISLIFGIVTFQRTKIWNNSGKLWTNVIEQYPETPYPRTNRANYTSKLALDPAHQNERDSLYQQALEDCALALSVNPDLAAGYEKRALIYLDLKKDKEAFDDVNSLLRVDPINKLGYYVRGTLYAGRNEVDKGLADFNKALSISADYHQALNNRGTLYLNYYKKYPEALSDFNEAIRLSPQGNYFLNRSICYYKLGDMPKAKADAQTAREKGASIPDNYRQILNL